MKWFNKNNKRTDQMLNNSTYITEAVIKPNEENPLRSYVNMLDSKMDYAKWKQNLVLSYNYMPLANIKQKLQNDRITYIKKMQQQEAKLKALVDNQQIMTLLSQLSGFKSKLEAHSIKLQKKIAESKVTNKKLRAKVDQRRQKLKQLKKQRRQNVIIELKQQGVTSVRQIKSILRSKSTLSGTEPHSANLGSLQNTKPVNLYISCINSLQNSMQKLKKKKQTETNELLKHKISLHEGNSKNTSNVRSGKKEVGMKEIKQANNSFINLRMMNNYNSVPARIDVNVSASESIDKDQNNFISTNMSRDKFMGLSFDSLVQVIFQKDPNGEALRKLLVQIN